MAALALWRLHAGRLALALAATVAGLATAVAGLAPAVADAASFAEVLWRTPTARLPALAWKPRRSGGVVLSRDGKAALIAHAAGVSALRSDTGALLWQVTTADPVDAAVVEGRGVVYFADVSGVLRAVNRDSGRTVWRDASAPVALGAAVRAPLRVAGNRLYAMAEPGSLFALDASDGKVQWRRAGASSREFLAEGHGAATLVGDAILAGLGDGNLVLVSARDGGALWSRDLAGLGDGQPDVDGTPVVVDDGALVLAASHRGGLYGVRFADGDVRWHLKGEGYATPVVDQDRCYVFDASHTLVALRWRDGVVVGARRIDGEPSGAMTVTRHGLLVPTGAGLSLLRGDDLGLRGRIVDPYGFAAAPAVAGELVYALANDGAVYALRLRLATP